MSSIEINGGNVEYEVLGPHNSTAASDELIVLTPGGRFSKDIPGLRPLAEALVEGGKRVLLWDRPNTGVADVQFYGKSESHMRAETLKILLTELGEGPCVLAGGSGGARDSIVTTMLYPELTTKLVVWNIVGGVFGSFSLGSYYAIPSIQVVQAKGIDGLFDLPEWQERIALNPANADRLRALDRAEFLQLILIEVGIGVIGVPRPNESIEEECLRKRSHLFRSSIRAEPQQMDLNAS